jgi:CDP-6-deoxy-D-xylo-4-hexulose-3-dehydrase
MDLNAETSDVLRAEILKAVRAYCALQFKPAVFRPGITPIPASGKVFDGNEMALGVDAVMDFWLTTGHFAKDFEMKFSRRLAVDHAVLTNSGSSANLLAVSSLTSPALGDARLLPADEVITVAASFPTTVNPILQNGAIPVFLDVTLGNYAMDLTHLEDAITSKTKAIIAAHTLGNPFRADQVQAIAKKHHLWFIEDACDALGSTLGGRPVGSFSDLTTFSFYPAHHITMGEGGAVVTPKANLRKILESFRDWGRDCWCDPGKDDTCGKRFQWKLGDLPAGYDHKYTYSHLGYNLKLTDIQAAIGLAQLDKLDSFVAARKRNFSTLYQSLKEFEEFLILPEATEGSDPAWFGFPITLRSEAPFTREDLTRHLNDHKIGTRLLFAGNITKQPYFKGRPYRIAGSLSNTDTVMEKTFWIGVYPGITEDMLAYVSSQFHSFFAAHVFSAK